MTVWIWNAAGPAAGVYGAAGTAEAARRAAGAVLAAGQAGAARVQQAEIVAGQALTCDYCPVSAQAVPGGGSGQVATPVVQAVTRALSCLHPAGTGKAGHG